MVTLICRNLHKKLNFFENKGIFIVLRKVKVLYANHNILLKDFQFTLYVRHMPHETKIQKTTTTNTAKKQRTIIKFKKSNARWAILTQSIIR